MWWLLLLSHFIETSTAAGCGAAFSLPIKDVLVTPDIPGGYEIGIPAQIGTPPQDIVVLPWIELNNTYIYNDNPLCDTGIIFGGDEPCIVRRGGLFYESESSTYSNKTNLIAAGGASKEITTRGAIQGISELISTSLAGTDDFNLASSGVLSNFPIGVPRTQFKNEYSTLHPLGMGRNSTFLNALYNAKTIPSRVWSLYWGRMWTTNNPLDGSVVVGGYDEKKVTGKNYTQKLDYSNNCYTGLKTTITDVVLNFRSGKDVSLLNSTTLPACIVPTRPNLLQPPVAIQQAFENVTGIKSIGRAIGVNWDAMQFYPPNNYDGDITIKLDSGLIVRVPNDQFVIPDTYYYAQNGSRDANDSLINVAISEGSGPWTGLGRYFLTAAYLMVDHDEATWTLWNANATNSTSLKTITRNGNNCSALSGPTPSGTAPADSSNDTPSKSGLSKGVIAGIVVGILVITAIILTAILGFLRRKRSQLNKSSAPTGFVREPKPTERLELHNDSMSYTPVETYTGSGGGKGMKHPIHHQHPALVELQSPQDEVPYRDMKPEWNTQVYEMPDRYSVRRDSMSKNMI